MPPYHVFKNDGSKQVSGTVSGHLFRFITAHLNVSYDLIDGGNDSGQDLGPGNWTGAVGMIIRQEADVLMTMFANLPELAPYLDFTSSMGAVDYGILSGPPNKVNSQSHSLISSIGTIPLTCLLISWVLVSISYCCLLRLSFKTRMNQRLDKRLGGIFFSFYTMMFQKGFRHDPIHLGTRLIIASWMLGTFVLTTVVEGTLYSKLAIIDVPERIENLKDILKHPNMIPFIAEGLGPDSYLANSENSEHQALWLQVLRTNGLSPTADIFHSKSMDAVSSGTAVILGNSILLPTLVNRACSSKRRFFYLSRSSYMSQPVSFVHRKGFRKDLVEILNSASIFYGEMGFFERIRQKDMSSAAPCLRIVLDRNVESPLGLKELLKPIWFLLIGFMVSVLVLVLELSSNSFFQYRSRC